MAATDPVDWKLDDDGDLVIPIVYTTGLEAVRQGIRIRLRLVKGEYFSNLDAGVDWYGVILGQRYNDQAVMSEFRRAISAAPGVGQILSLSSKYDSADRVLSVSWHVQANLDNLTGEIRDSLTIEVAS